MHLIVHLLSRQSRKMARTFCLPNRAAWIGPFSLTDIVTILTFHFSSPSTICLFLFDLSTFVPMTFHMFSF
jgi:hypothetical protein